MKASSVSFQGKMVSVLGLRGLISDGIYTIDINFGSEKKPKYVLVQGNQPEKPISQKIEELILADKAAGKEALIDHVLISNRYAVHLYMEGRLTREMLESAKEENGDLVIDLYFAGAKRKVVVRSELKAEYHCATIDAKGKVV